MFQSIIRYNLTHTVCMSQTFVQPQKFLSIWNFDMLQIWPNQECMPKIRVLRTCEHAQFLQGSVIIKFRFLVILVLFTIEFSIFIWTCSQVLRTLIFGMHSWFGHIWNISKFQEEGENWGWINVCEIQPMSVNLSLKSIS